MSAMYCAACGQDSAELLRRVADLRRRIASVRYIIKRASHDPDTMAVVRDLLDLRKPPSMTRRPFGPTIEYRPVNSGKLGIRPGAREPVCATCGRDSDHVGGRYGPPCPDCNLGAKPKEK